MKQENAQVVNARKDGCGIELADGWYSSFNALKPKPSKGDIVTFDYKVKEVGGRTYKNIDEKTFSVKSNGDSSGVKSSASGFSGRPNVGFPIPTDHGNRAINRQSAIAQAVTVMGQIHTETQLHKMTPEQYTDILVAMARDIESYTTGDLDSEIVKKLLEDSNSDDE